ncbi:hypothetical protein SAMN02745775_101537 [Falsiroseomonas stagni DSM 19981]|uniref:Uncharacterized protein n=1 Tax=Falsiroseomonas stagni DSM 19981 TaxID=1123062 RepID=A0A1I3XPH6_9PROT|nr:hypothetical protein SAMN02745775_101537 [Falsiroseomonas stagni DSM 19981]
MGRTEQRR